MKTVLILVAAVMLSACATSYQRAAISEDVTYQPWNQWEAINTVRFPSSKVGNPAGCIAQHVTNDAVVANAQPGLVAALSGTYHVQGHGATAGGGETIVHADDQMVVARGATGYPGNMGVFFSLRYTMTADHQGYTFSNISQSVNGSGQPMPVGGWESANPQKAVAALKSVANSIDNCRI